MRARTKTRVAVGALLVALAAAPATGWARKPVRAAKAPPTPNADQQEVVAAIVNDSFPRPKREPLTLALCLDVRIEAAVDEDAAPPPAPRRGAAKKRVRPRTPEAPPTPIVQGAPADLVTRVARPWRVVSSALACHLDPRQPYALGDAAHTPAQLVTVHLAPDVASGTLRIDWAPGSDPSGGSSRDCTATRGPHGWNMHCGGTWFQ
jgi:hypothetical protein